MKWLVGLIMAFVFIKLGMLMVMVNLLELALQLSVFVLTCLGIFFLWRKVFEKKLKSYPRWSPRSIFFRNNHK